MDHCKLLLRLVRRRRSFAKVGRLCIISCALFICCTGGIILVSAVDIPACSIDEGQPTSTPPSNSQTPRTSFNSLLSRLWSRRKQPQTTAGSAHREDVSTDNSGSELEAKIGVEPFDSERDLGSAEPGSQQIKGLGFIKLIGPDNTMANFFSCSFAIYSRNKNVKKIETRNNAEHLFDLNELAPEKGVFNASRRTVILVPGYRSNDYEQWMNDAKNRWLELEDVNVILVHWNKGSNGFYNTVVRNTRIVGRQIVILLYYLAKLNHVDFASEQFRQSIHLIGFSCGSHIAGFVGRELGGKVDRITGLDPAGPTFDSLNASERLNAKNAKFVDIIHTNSGKSPYMTRFYALIGQLWCRKKICSLADIFSRPDKNQASLKRILQEIMNKADTAQPASRGESDLPESTIRFGIEQQIGHVDYYVNGGTIQPGCDDITHICDHNRAIYVYLSVLEYQLQAKQQAERVQTQGDTNEQADLHRLIAFAANSHEDYKTGASLVRNCPEISLSSPAALASKKILSDESFDEAFKRCTIPIDFVKTADEYRKELPDDAKSGDSNRTTRYYFDTLAHEPFVSDYYLMRLHVPSLSFGDFDHRWSREKVSEDGQCRLFSSLHSVKTNDKQQLSSQIADYRPWNYTAPGNYYSQLYIGLILPLLNPNDWGFHFPMRQHIYQQIQQSNQSDEAADKLRLLVPNAISISLMQLRKQQKQKRKQKANVNSAIRNNDTQTNCNISFSDIELSPLTKALNRSFSLWFSLDAEDECHDDLNSTTARKPIIINKPYEVDHAVRLNWTGEPCSIPLKTISLLSQT